MDINVISTGSCGTGETWFDREITAEQYARAKRNHGYLTGEDAEKVLSAAERYGYGATARSVFDKGGKYYVHCHRYNNCD